MNELVWIPACYAVALEEVTHCIILNFYMMHNIKCNQTFVLQLYPSADKRRWRRFPS